MAITITRTAFVDDDGSGSTGTVLNNAVKTELYNQIDAALAAGLPLAGGTLVGDLKFADATYDIGKSGATRPRDLFLSRNASVAALAFNVGANGSIQRKLFSMTGGAAPATITKGLGPGLVCVAGYNSVQARRFIDVVTWDGFFALATVVSASGVNTPAARTYATDGAGGLTLALAGAEVYGSCATIELAVSIS